MKFAVNFSILAETGNRDALDKYFCNRVNRWHYGIYLPRNSNREIWDIPDCVKKSELYVEATYPVGDYIVTVLDSYGNKINPMIDSYSVQGLTFEKVICRGSMMVFVMDSKNREVSIRKINVVEKNGQAILLRRRLFNKQLLPPEGKLAPQKFNLPRDNFLGMFWRVLIDACNKVNIDDLMLKNNGNPITARKVVTSGNGGEKVVIRMGI